MDQEKNSPDTIVLTVIGCGDAFSSGGAAQSCFHLETARGNFLIDCGAGALAGLKKNDLSLEEVDTVIISHFHGDHYGGLPYLLLQAATKKRQKLLTIFSPPGCKQKMKQLLDLLYPGTKVLDKLKLAFIDFENNQEIDQDYFSLTPFSVNHKPESNPFGLRLEISGKIISYSGDTGWTDRLLDIAAEADLFICECCFYESNIPGHLNYLQLTENMDRLTARNILLTHFDQEMLDHRDEVDFPCAYDGQRLLI